MKQFIFLMAFAILSFSSSAQQNADEQRNQVESLVATLSASSLHITWSSNKKESVDWEVQGSIDGNAYSAIGLVLGADPSNPGGYRFKQQTEKMKPGLKFFRVVRIDKEGQGLASEPIQLTK